MPVPDEPDDLATLAAVHLREVYEWTCPVCGHVQTEPLQEIDRADLPAELLERLAPELPGYERVYKVTPDVVTCDQCDRRYGAVADLEDADFP